VIGRTLRVLLQKELRQVFRDRFMVAQLLLMPMVQLILLGNAATFEVKEARMFVVDQDHSQMSRAIVQKLEGTRRFVLVGSSVSMKPANDAILSRNAGMILGIPAGFESDIVNTGTGHVQLILNAEDGAAAGVTSSYVSRILADYSRGITVELKPEVRAIGAIDVRGRGWFNPELDYRHYMVPGILVQLITVVGTLMTAMNIVREKEIGTLEQLNVTPLSRGVFIAAKLLPMVGIALVELTIGLLIARYIFGVPMRGSITLVYAAALLYLVGALGIGLWISTIVETQQQAMFVTLFIVMIYLLMSGLFTPVRSMPNWAQWMAEANPVKHFIELVRAVLLKGATIGEVRREIFGLSAIGIAALTLAVRQYHKAAG
jgi:ABC-2 type transport system permease protein